MTLRIPNAAEEAFLDLILAEGYTLRLFTNDVEAGLTEAQKEALTAGSFTEATFTGYAASAITGGTWTTTPGDDESVGTNTQRTFTRTSTGAGQTVRGYYVTRTTGGALRWYEYFPGPITVTDAGDTIQITPTLTLDDYREATVAARGVIARQILTGSNGPHSAAATTDFALSSVAVDSSRLYAVHLQTSKTMTAIGNWGFFLHVGGVQTLKMGKWNEVDASFPLENNEHYSKLWLPATGTFNLDIRVAEETSSGDLTLVGGAVDSRQFWVEDVGQR